MILLLCCRFVMTVGSKMRDVRSKQPTTQLLYLHVIYRTSQSLLQRHIIIQVSSARYEMSITLPGSYQSPHILSDSSWSTRFHVKPSFSTTLCTISIAASRSLFVSLSRIFAWWETFVELYHNGVRNECFYLICIWSWFLITWSAWLAFFLLAIVVLDLSVLYRRSELIAVNLSTPLCY